MLLRAHSLPNSVFTPCPHVIVVPVSLSAPHTLGPKRGQLCGTRNAARARTQYLYLYLLRRQLLIPNMPRSRRRPESVLSSGSIVSVAAMGAGVTAGGSSVNWSAPLRAVAFTVAVRMTRPRLPFARRWKGPTARAARRSAGPREGSYQPSPLLPRSLGGVMPSTMSHEATRVDDQRNGVRSASTHTDGRTHERIAPRRLARVRLRAAAL